MQVKAQLLKQPTALLDSLQHPQKVAVLCCLRLEACQVKGLVLRSLACQPEEVLANLLTFELKLVHLGMGKEVDLAA